MSGAATTTVEASPGARFREELLRAGLLLGTGVDGVYGRAERFDAVVEAVVPGADLLRPLAEYERVAGGGW